MHWADLAIEAEIEGRKTDALAYYQAALNARANPPDKRFGRVEAPLDDAHKLFLVSGGSETAWNIWSGRPLVKSATATDVSWNVRARTCSRSNSLTLRERPGA